MKIIMVLTNGFFPDLRVYKEAKYLSKNGHDVEILCWDRDGRYKEKPVEQIEKIKIIRFCGNEKYGSGLKQISGLMKFKNECKKYLKNEQINYDYIHCHDLDGMVVGWLIHKHGDKIVFDMHEYYNSGSYAKIYFIVKRLLKFMQNKSYKIIHVNEKQIEAISPKNKDKLVYLPNYPEAEKFESVKHIPSSKLRIMYAGYVRYLVPLTNLINATKDMENVKVSIHGTGTCWDNIKKMEEFSKNLEVTGEFKHEEINKFYSESDIIYVVYNKGNKNDETALPTKFFESIISGVPLIVSKDSLMEKTVEKYDIGFNVDGTNEENIKKLIESIQNNREILEQKKRNIEKIKNKFIWEDVVKNLDKIYGRNN